MLENSQITFISEIKNKVRNAHYEAMKAVNVVLTIYIWKSISESQAENLGKSVVAALSKELQKEFPGVGGFSVGNLWLMDQFYSEYQSDINLIPLVREISWTKHIVVKIIKYIFYEKCSSFSFVFFLLFFLWANA